MSGQFERDLLQQRGKDLERQQERSRFGGDGYSGPSSPDQERAEPDPTIRLPETMSPKGLVEVTMDKEKWLQVLR